MTSCLNNYSINTMSLATVVTGKFLMRELKTNSRSIQFWHTEQDTVCGHRHVAYHVIIKVLFN